MQAQPLTCGQCAQCCLPQPEDRPRGVGLELPVDLVDQGQALGPVERLRLLDHEPVDLLRAVAGEVPLRPAAIVLEELGVGIVDADAGQVQGHLVLEARHLRVPDARLDLLEGRLDPDLLELVDHPARRVDVDRERAGGDHELHRIGGAEAGLGQQLLGLGLSA